MSEIVAVTGVSYRRNNGSNRYRHANNSSRHLRVYGIDSQGKIVSKRTNRIKAIWYRFRKVHRNAYTCSSCGTKYHAIYRKKRDLKKLKCPCGEPITITWQKRKTNFTNKQ